MTVKCLCRIQLLELKNLPSVSLLACIHTPTSAVKYSSQIHKSSFPSPSSSFIFSFLLNFLSLYFTYTQISRCVPFSFIDYFSVDHIFLVWRSSPNGLESDFKVSFFFTTLPFFFFHFNQDLYHLEDKICPQILKMSSEMKWQIESPDLVLIDPFIKENQHI